MDQERKEKTILHLTLEIIYLLTGEDYIVVKKTSGECVAPSRSGGWNRARGPITEPPPPSLMPERNNEQKILELTHKMMELLTGEGENLLDFKIEVVEEEGKINVRSDRPCKEEDIPTDIIPGGHSKDLGQRHLPSIVFEGDQNNIPNIPQFICLGCGKWFKPESDQETQKKETQIQCSECRKCPKQKSAPTELPVGKKTHSGKKPILCLDCGRSFTKKSHLVEHRKIHTGEKLFSCSECGKSFTKKSNLVQHLKLHTGEKPYSCSECGKKFTKKYGLLNHHWIHRGEKPFSCPECDKSFTQKSDLVKHQRSHTGERPFPCLECGKYFTQRSVLAKHKRIHQEGVSTVLHTSCFYTY